MKQIIIGFIIFGTILSSAVVFAATEQSVRDQINATNNQIQALDREIKKYQDQIAQTAEEKNTLARLIKELTLTRTKLVKEKEQTEKKIQATGLVIGALSTNITKQEKVIDVSKETLARMLNEMYRRDSITLTERVLTQDTLSDASREYNDIMALNDEIKSHIKKVVVEKDALLATKTQKEGEKKNLTELKKTLVQKQQVVEVTTKQKDTLLKETQNKESNYKKLLADTQKRKEAFEKAIEDYEAQLTFILNSKSIPKAGSSPLAWPVSSVLVTSQYGPRWGRFHYGLDFRAAVGTKIMAMGSGTVMGTGDTDLACKGASFGKWVFIKYNNGLSSTYGHLSVITAKVGQEVSAGDVVGLSGNTGSSTGPHLHVAVYASDGVKVDTVPSRSCGGKIFTQPIAALNAYLDPALYLPKITKSMVKS